MICKGDYVKIGAKGYIYSTYPEFFIENDIRDRLNHYVYGASPTDEEVDTSIFKVIFVSVGKLRVITNGTHDYLIDVDGLKKVSVIESDEENMIEKGDTVRITDEGQIYSLYDEFLIRHKGAISNNRFWNFKVGLNPSDLENKPDAYEVEGVFPHPENSKINLAIVCSDENTFIVDVKALRKED